MKISELISKLGRGRNKTFNRFKKLLNDGRINSDTGRVFSTNLGDRLVEMSYVFGANTYSCVHGISMTYYDKDGSVLFSVEVDKNGLLKVLEAKIDEVAIFSAIYELETIVYQDRRNEKLKQGETLINLLQHGSKRNYCL